jgi:cytoskeleton protein RodZ
VLEIGTTLRAAREARGATLDDAAEATKIRPSHLQAMEEEAFERLPGPTYARGFLRAYADWLGLDTQLLVDEYSERFAAVPWEVDDDLMFPRRRGPRGPRRIGRESGIAVIAMAGIVAVAVLVVIASTFPDRGAPPVLPPTGETAIVTVTEAAVNPMATAVTAETVLNTESVAAPLEVVVRPLAETTITVRAIDAPAEEPPLFQDEIAPAEGREVAIELPRSSTGYLVRLDRPDTVVLEVNGRSVAPGPTVTLLTIDPDGRVAAAE